MKLDYYIHYLTILEVQKFSLTNEGFKQAFNELSNKEITQIINNAISKYPDQKIDIVNEKLSTGFWVYIFSIAFPDYINRSVDNKNSNTVNTKTANVTIVGFDHKKTISMNNKASKELDNFIEYGELPED